METTHRHRATHRSPSSSHTEQTGLVQGSAAHGDPRGRGTLDEHSLRAFFATLIPRQLADHHIPGAVVAVVAHGQIVFAQGYGYADVAQRVPIVAARTLVNIGSCGKLFTWTAVMQQVEQGQLDLQADVNSYLDFRLPATYPQPITLTHLMTHTAGFANRDLGLAVPHLDAVPPLGDWLAAHVPARSRPPGVEAGYSNYGAALAGYIVARMAGVPYPRYLSTHILQPLGMQRTTPDQRLPPEWAPDLAHGYLFIKGRFVERPFDVLAFGATAGGQYATALDMARFMIAHLHDGRYGEARILQEQTSRQMHGTLFRVDPRLNGMAHGFMELDRNGHRIIGHIGNATAAFSLVALLPDDDVGLFVSYNGAEALALIPTNATLAAFVDQVYPAPAAAPLAPPADFAQRADTFRGTYQPNNFGGAVTTIEKARRLLGTATYTISAPGDGSLAVTSALEGRTHYVEVAPLFFRRVGGQEALLFRRNGHGRMTRAFFSTWPEYAYERLAWYESPRLNQRFLAVCTGVFSSVVLVVPLSGLRHGRVTGAAGGPAGQRQGRLARIMLASAATLNLLFGVGLALELKDPHILWGDFRRLRALLGLPVLASLCSLGAGIGAVAAWRRWWSLPARLHYSLGTIVGLVFSVFLRVWNLLGFRL